MSHLVLLVQVVSLVRAALIRPSRATSFEGGYAGPGFPALSAWGTGSQVKTWTMGPLAGGCYGDGLARRWFLSRYLSVSLRKP